MEITKEKAIELGKTVKWNEIDDVVVFLFQINQEKLCMDFDRFHKATEKALGRSVWTHEFAKPEILLDEFFGLRDKATLQDIMVTNVDTEIRKKMVGVIVK